MSSTLCSIRGWGAFGSLRVHLGAAAWAHRDHSRGDTEGQRGLKGFARHVGCETRDNLRPHTPPECQRVANVIRHCVTAREVQVQNSVGPPVVLLRQFLEFPTLLRQSGIYVGISEGDRAIPQLVQLCSCHCHEFVCLDRVTLETDTQSTLARLAKLRCRERHVISHGNAVNLATLEPQDLDQAGLEQPDEQAQMEELTELRLCSFQCTRLGHSIQLDWEDEDCGAFGVNHVQLHVLLHWFGRKSNAERCQRLAHCKFAPPFNLDHVRHQVGDRPQVLLQEGHQGFLWSQATDHHERPLAWLADAIGEDHAGTFEVEPENAPKAWGPCERMVLRDNAL
mmetsp:Transcript_33122/g.77031  ORF Transcript_33122/g.77031 Transcript_33122/m.77031 type:complete len:338 (-) Transcript_33122:560-1573(-)